MNDDDDTYKTRETLLEKIKNKHDDKSWEDFVYYYEKFIYLICLRMNVNHHDSEEIVQKVLLYAWKALPDFVYDNSKNFRGWLCFITKSTVKDFFKHVKSQNTRIEKASNEDGVYSLDNMTEPQIEKIAEEEWSLYLSNMAFMSIKDKFSENVIDVFLKLSEGQSPSDIAEEMNIPVNTVAVYKKRVITKMYQEIRRLNNELG